MERITGGRTAIARRGPKGLLKKLEEKLGWAWPTCCSYDIQSESDIREAMAAARNADRNSAAREPAGREGGNEKASVSPRHRLTNDQPKVRNRRWSLTVYL